jgi:hypothetical protein
MDGQFLAVGDSIWSPARMAREEIPKSTRMELGYEEEF